MSKNPIICIGAALIDESFSCLSEPIVGTSNPATFYRSTGGVACNIANHLSLLGNNVELLSHFGNELEGKWLRDECLSNGIGISHSLLNGIDTGRYVALLSPSGELFAGAVSSQIESLITIGFLEEKIQVLKSASVLQIDCNLDTDVLNWILDFSKKENIPCIIETVSVPKASKLLNANLQNVLLITPNHDEMAALTGNTSDKSSVQMIQQLLDKGVKNLWVRNGKMGSQLFTKEKIFELSAPRVNVVDTTGAGDAALAGWIHAWLMKKNPEDCIRYGHAMASIILQTRGSVQKNLNKELLETNFQNYK